MQTWSGQNPAGAISSTRKFSAITLLVFSLAGLIAGFAIGGLTGARSHTPTNNTGLTKKQTPVVQNTSEVTPTATVQPVVPLNPPNTLNMSAPTQKADGATTYNLTIQTVDRQKQAIHSPNITCKLWLVKQIPDGKTLTIDPALLKAVAALGATIPGTIAGTSQVVPEVANSLTFDATTPQLTLCNSNGQMTWNYRIAPTVPPGTYDLVFLTDWQGIHFNWSWDSITIQ